MQPQLFIAVNYRNPKLLAAVRLLSCVNCGSVGTQAAHANLIELGSGTGIKAKDSAIMSLCVQKGDGQCGCHFELDNGNKMSKAERREFTYEMIAKTLMKLIEAGLLKVV